MFLLTNQQEEPDHGFDRSSYLRSSARVGVKEVESPSANSISTKDKPTSYTLYVPS